MLLLTAVLGVAVYLLFKWWSSAAASTKLPEVSTEEITKQKRPVTILYGSQTGTAAMYAKALHRESVRLAVPAVIMDIEDFHPHTSEDETMIIFVLATYGEGEPTDTVKPFYDWLYDADRKSGELADVKFAVFGLGDRQWKQFCQMGVNVDKKMAELGAERVYALGCGDCGSNLEEAFDAWRKDLWPAVGASLKIQIKADTEDPVPTEFSLKIVTEPEAQAQFPFSKTIVALEPTQRTPAYLTVVSNTQLLRNSSDRQTHRMVFSIASTPISYQAGDHLGILPCNSDATVDECIRLLDGAAPIADQYVAVVDKNNRNQLPQRVRLRMALKWYVDLCGPPKKSALRAFAHYCTNPAEKEAMLSILRVNDKAQEQFRKVIQETRHILGIFKKYPSCRVPVGHFLELMPRIAPRYFSISSDQLRQPQTVEATVAIVADGLCTQMLKNLTAGAEVPAFVRKSIFHLPLKAKTRPLVMIGPGTGVAPLIGFCQRRQAWREKNHDIGPCMFFFGCRKKNEDYIYQQELENWAKTGIITKLDVAFSRDQKAKVYVQDKIRQSSDEIWRQLTDGANLYICGDAKHMAKDVESALLDIAMQKGGLTRTAAAEYFEKLEKDERFLRDVWSG